MAKTAGKHAKELGLKGGLSEMKRHTDQSLNTLTNWFHNKRRLFETVVAGCIARNKQD